MAHSVIIITIRIKIRKNKFLIENIFKYSESKIVMHKIQTTRLSDRGIYTCCVENKYGSFEQYAWYEILPLPLLISIPNGRYIAEENEPEFIIPCIVQSPSKSRQYQIKWFLNDTEILPDNKIYNVNNFSLIKRKKNA